MIRLLIAILKILKRVYDYFDPGADKYTEQLIDGWEAKKKFADKQQEKYANNWRVK